MSDKVLMAALIQEAANCDNATAEKVADHLIANNIGFLKKPPQGRTPINLTGKCGGCANAVRIPTSGTWIKCGIKPPNAPATVRQRTAKACKKFIPCRQEIIQTKEDVNNAPDNDQC